MIVRCRILAGLVMLFSMGMAQESGTVYQVEPGVRGNTIELEVANKLSTSLSNLSVSVLEKPDWVTIKTGTVETSILPADSIGLVRITFDILPARKSGEKGNITIVMNAGGSRVAQKTIALMVAVPKTYALDQNYPNPFNPLTTIKYDLPKDEHVALKVYDILGREVRTLVDEFMKAGYQQITFNASEFASGVYFYRLTTPSYVSVKKMVIAK